MKLNLFNLQSLVLHGVGGLEAGSLNLIYCFLLEAAGQTAYRRISIYQIGDDLEEVFQKFEGKVYLNIRYPAYEDFKSRSPAERNRIRLEIAHTALLRIAEKEKKLDVEKLHAIRDLILEKDFSFEFPIREFINKKHPALKARISLAPEIDRFDFYLTVLKEEKEVLKLLVYSGNQTGMYLGAFFRDGKWTGEDELTIKGQSLESAFRIMINEKKFETINYTSFPVAPYLEMMRAGITDEQRREYGKLWEKNAFSAFGYSIKPTSK